MSLTAKLVNHTLAIVCALYHFTSLHNLERFKNWNDFLVLCSTSMNLQIFLCINILSWDKCIYSKGLKSSYGWRYFFQFTSLLSHNIADVTGGKGPLTKIRMLAGKAYQFNRCVKKAEGHLKRLGDENDRERFAYPKTWSLTAMCNFCIHNAMNYVSSNVTKKKSLPWIIIFVLIKIILLSFVSEKSRSHFWITHLFSKWRRHQQLIQ